MQVPWVKAGTAPPHNVKQSVKCFSQPVSYKNPAALELPVTYVAFVPKDKSAEERAKTDKSWQRAVARGWTIRTFPGGHVDDRCRAQRRDRLRGRAGFARVRGPGRAAPLRLARAALSLLGAMGAFFHGIRFRLHYRNEVLHLRVPLIGAHSVHTALRAAAVGPHDARAQAFRRKRPCQPKIQKWQHRGLLRSSAKSSE